MKNCFRQMIFVVAILVFSFPFAPNALAQPGNERFGFRGRRDISMLLLATRDVRRELEVSREQRRMVDALVDDVRAQQQRRRSTTTEKLMRVVLDKDQSKRLAELQLQFEGPYAIDDRDFAKELQLTEEQREAVESVRKKKLVSDIQDLADELGKEPLSKWQKRLGKTYTFSPEVALLREEYLKQRKFLETNPRRRRR